MKAKHRRTLEFIHTTPTSGDIEALIVALGGEIREGSGSRVVFELDSSRQYLRRPPPGKEAMQYQVEELRKWLTDRGITR